MRWVRRSAAAIVDVTDRVTGSRRATIDTVEAEVVSTPPSPLQPIDLIDDAAVTEALDLSIRVGEVLLASGTGAMDTAAQVQFVAATYGLGNCDVDVTYNSIVVNAKRGLTLPPAGTMRVVRYRSLDFTRLAAVDRLVRRIRRGAVSPTDAHRALDMINSAPHPYSRWIATAAWAGMAAAVSLLLGGGPLVFLVTFLTTVAIDRVNRVLNRIGLPFFYQQVVGGIIATLPAALLYAARGTLGIEISPSQVIAAGVIVLLSGLSLVGSVQDAITGAPITASARFFEVMVTTGGIIAGVATGLRAVEAMGISMPPLSTLALPDLTDLSVRVLAGAAAAGFFALACYAERRALPVAAMAGAAGTLVYVVAIAIGIGPVIASASAATVVGLAGGLMARRALTPPQVVAVAGITPLLPGLAVYRGLYALLNDQLLVGFSNLAAALGIGCALAAGVVLGEWVARTMRRPRILQRTSQLRRPTLRRRTNLRKLKPSMV